MIAIVGCLVLASFAAIRAEEGDLTDDPKGLFKQVQIFADSVTIISTDYVEALKIKDLIYGAIKGMMNTLDGYSQFLDPESFREITEETRGEFGGIGIEIGIRDGVLTVIAPIEDTPASKAGIMAGDKIVKIDGDITRDMTLDDAVEKLRGDAGTKVALSVIRGDEDRIYDFEIERAVIKLKSIKDFKVIEDDIGYIRLIEFQERTGRDLKAAVKDLIKQGARSLIIDIRNNPGGLLDAAVEVSDMFLKPGSLIVYTEGRDPEKRMDFKSKKTSDFDDLNLVIIVNKGSASASEIFAGALKDNMRAVTVGTTTFGKGSVQTVIPLKDKSALRLTTASYYTPSGKNLRDKGIEPDITVELVKVSEDEEGEETEKKKDRVFDKVKDTEEKTNKPSEKKNEPGEYDSQLQAAVNVLKGARIFEQFRTSEAVKQPAEEQ